MKYFPELCDTDEYITEFAVNQNRNEVFRDKLDPDTLKYMRPDFGFND